MALPGAAGGAGYPLSGSPEETTPPPFVCTATHHDAPPPWYLPGQDRWWVEDPAEDAVLPTQVEWQPQTPLPCANTDKKSKSRTKLGRRSPQNEDRGAREHGPGLYGMGHGKERGKGPRIEIFEEQYPETRA